MVSQDASPVRFQGQRPQPSGPASPPGGRAPRVHSRTRFLPCVIHPPPHRPGFLSPTISDERSCAGVMTAFLQRTLINDPSLNSANELCSLCCQQCPKRSHSPGRFWASAKCVARSLCLLSVNFFQADRCAACVFETVPLTQTEIRNLAVKNLVIYLDKHSLERPLRVLYDSFEDCFS